MSVVSSMSSPIRAAGQLLRSAVASMSEEEALEIARMARTEVHVAADIRGFGTEVRRVDDPDRNLVMTPPAELGLSEKLVYDFRSWQSWFDSVVDLCGLDERFKCLGDKFDEVGQQLAQRVAIELGSTVRVTYGPQGGWCRRMGRGLTLVIPCITPEEGRTSR